MGTSVSIIINATSHRYHYCSFNHSTRTWMYNYITLELKDKRNNHLQLLSCTANLFLFETKSYPCTCLSHYHITANIVLIVFCCLLLCLYTTSLKPTQIFKETECIYSRCIRARTSL